MQMLGLRPPGAAEHREPESQEPPALIERFPVKETSTGC